ncbi:hypothetical protein KIPB_005909 [Kipferlia bialata]|uniref:EF-hand domain-containing protein n=1 Tax=Kipferlia bialata TaxID=797122 RepID=A0A9K3CW93_9EUKA|nr:hypothetical protein KIPB_005909 [Kipferlia bialata]|eukprot:g5909.t1
MYSTEDSLALIVRVKDALRVEQEQIRVNAGLFDADGSPTLGPNAPKSRRLAATQRKALLQRKNQVRFSTFEAILLDYQLQGHERFLAKFGALFRRFDVDSDGVLQAREFKQLLSALNPGLSNQDLEAYLEEADPFSTDCVTFSQCVSLLSEELAHAQAE